ncbi:hypothetical protein AAFF_G00430050 [Aldrovandia affinis]|uniref:Saposin B-type domain-containing protein n=1 Tax=Aldrovandia affinis TaxID=143900 RepID=A0AAD7S8V6_9TELE|nr:hypothetical protein AAFF_G00430050 [Aldrovandia affinis]
MRSTFILCFLLVCTALAQGGHFHELGSLDTGDDMEAVTVRLLPGSCYVCKRVIEKVKKSLHDKASKEEIIKKLHNVCNKLGPVKSLCNKLVNKNLNKLAAELSSDDSPRQACVNMKLCKPKVFMEQV